MRLAGQAASVALAPLITALTGESNVRGTGSFDLDLTGTGGTVTETLQTAAGTMSFALNAGAIDGFNLGRTLCAAYNLRERLPQPAAAPAATEFQLIRASADVRNGIATTRDLLGQTAFLDLTGSGGMNLADARIDYTMAATLTAAVPISGCETMTEFVGDSIPFTIKGPLDSPSIEPDYREIVRRRVQDDVRERVEDRLRDRLRDLL
jgi:AsmA protein